MSEMDRFRQIYITECHELLADMESLLMGLDTEAADSEQLNAIFRCAHSIKGGSGAFGLDAITRFTHILEALLDAMREGAVRPTKEAVDLLLQSVDVVTQMVRAAEASTPVPADLGADIALRLVALSGSGAAAAPKEKIAEVAASGAGRYHITFKPHASLFLSGNEPLMILRELSRLGSATVTTELGAVPALRDLNPESCHISWQMILQTDASEAAIREVFEFVEDQCDLVIQRQEDAPLKQTAALSLVPAAASDKAPKAASAAGTIRVDLEKVDRLVNMVGELVITETMLRAQLRHVGADQLPELMRGIDELAHHTRELQEAVMSVRMQPLKSIFSRMPRLVRDISGQLGKQIQFKTSGEETEVDKTVIEQLGDPLTHMIRNSADHGIESPEKRMAAGKNAAGTIHLSAYQRGGRIIIEIAGDGAGINRERVLAKAIEKGLVEGDGSELAPEQIDHLIFLPGFSTAEVLSDISGRGVGMDVVKRNIESLGGSVRVSNQPGAGSVFTVSLPLTLAILDGMIVRVGAEHYIIPITSIIETMRPRREEVHRVEGRADVINVRGEYVPLLYLAQAFSVAGAQLDPSKALVVLVESGSEKLGLVVDELVNQQQVVIKSIAANADPVAGISGATILGDGKVSLILEINELKQLSRQHPPPVVTQAA